MKQDKLMFPDRALGAMSLGTDEAHAISLIQQAGEAGVTMIDVADLYEFGDTERVVGKAIQGNRDHFFLVSKGGNQPLADRTGWTWNPDPQYLEKALDSSLERLQTDYLDLYLLHGGTMGDPIDEIITLFERKKSEGIIRGYGISSIRPQVIKHWADHSNMSAVMSQYSLLDRRPEEQIFPLLEAAGIPVLARGTLAKGILSHKPAGTYLGRTAVENNQIIRRFQSSHNQPNDDHAAMSFASAEAAVSTIVVGASTSEQVSRLAAWEPQTDASWISELKVSIPPNCYQQHRL